jgi:hypothetical protein
MSLKNVNNPVKSILMRGEKLYIVVLNIFRFHPTKMDLMKPLQTAYVIYLNFVFI